MNLGINIKDYLSKTGRTQTYLAQKTGIDIKRLNALLNGVRLLYADEYFSICMALDVPVDTFIHCLTQKKQTTTNQQPSAGGTVMI